MIESKLDVIIPGINTDKWLPLMDSIMVSGNKYNPKCIFVGPKEPENIINNNNYSFIQDFGSPARALQIGLTACNNQFVTFTVDDGLVNPEILNETVDYLLDKDYKTIVNLHYTEGEDYKRGQDPRQQDPDGFYNARTHNDLKVRGVKEGWPQGQFYMMSTRYLKELGGFDCRFEAVNFNVHDLTFRALKDGATFIKYLDRNRYFTNLECIYGRTAETSPIIAAYQQNDLPLFKELWKDDSRPVYIDINNWQLAPAKWPRRYGNG